MKLLLSIFFAFLSTALANDRPNIIMILADDMPWSGTQVEMIKGLKGSNMPFRNTPNLDKLSKMGMTFSNAYAAAGMCAPSRTSFQTGTTTIRNRFTGNGNFGEDGLKKLTYDVRSKSSHRNLVEPYPLGSLNQATTTIGEALKNEGYKTAHFGKWHIYGGGPGENGYDEHDGSTSNDEGKAEDKNDPKLMFSMTDSAIDFMSRQNKAKSPFYCQISHYAEHNPCQSLPATLEKYMNHPHLKNIESKGDQKRWAERCAMIEDFDTTIGHILDFVEKNNLSKNTYIFFTADNGFDRYNEGNELLRGSKWWLWEAGIRVPMIVSGPHIEHNSRSDLNVIGYDFLPTFVDLAKGQPQNLNAIDGTSFKSILHQKNIDSTFTSRALYFHYPHHRTSAMHSAIIQGNMKLLYFYEIPDKFFLYNLTKDISERQNLSKQFPEKAKSLFSTLNKYLDEQQAFMPIVNKNPNPNYVPYDPDKVDLRSTKKGDLNGLALKAAK